MVRTKAPLLSLGASGAVGGVLVASNWRGRNYMKKLTIPLNPKTAAQVGVRAMLRFLTQHWTTLTDPEKATWEPLANQQVITPMDAYVQDGLNRWSTGKYPSQEYPATAAGAQPQVTNLAPTDQGRGILITYSNHEFADPCTGIIYHAPNAGFIPGYTNVIDIFDFPTFQTRKFLHTPVVLGWHNYRTACFSRTGKYFGPNSLISHLKT